MQKTRKSMGLVCALAAAVLATATLAGCGGGIKNDVHHAVSSEVHKAESAVEAKLGNHAAHEVCQRLTQHGVSQQTCLRRAAKVEQQDGNSTDLSALESKVQSELGSHQGS